MDILLLPFLLLAEIFCANHQDGEAEADHDGEKEKDKHQCNKPGQQQKIQITTSRPFYQQKFDQLKKIFPPKIGSIDDPILDKELIKKRQVKR